MQCRKTLCSALIQCHFDYSCSSSCPGINEGLKDKLEITQNKITRFILNYNSGTHVGFLNVSDRVKHLKHGHVIQNQKTNSKLYLLTNFQSLNESENSLVTRGTANNFLTQELYRYFCKTLARPNVLMSRDRQNGGNHIEYMLFNKKKNYLLL